MSDAEGDEDRAKRQKLGDGGGPEPGGGGAGHEGAGAAPAAAGRDRAGVNCLRARNKIHAVERDYTHHYAVGVNGEAGSDQYVFQHFNGLCLVGLAPSHAAMAGRRIAEVDFDVGRGGDRTDKKLSGKKKIGAAWLTEDSRLCDIVCDDGTRYRIRSCVKGHLMELNERLKEEPGLIHSKTLTEGYVAIITPKRDEEAKVPSKFLSETQYKEQIAAVGAGGGGAVPVVPEQSEPAEGELAQNEAMES